MITLTIASSTLDGGILRYSFNGHYMTRLTKYICPIPMYFATDKDSIHVLLRNPFPQSDESGLLELAVREDGSLKQVGEVIGTRGIEACHLCTLSEKIYVTNYASGSVFCDDGKVVQHIGKGVRLDRQEAPHTHFVFPAPDGNTLLCTDLGLDTVFQYDRSLTEISRSKVPDGHGCRHLVYSEDGKYVFCANELASTISVFRYDGNLSLISTVSTLWNENPESYCAAIRVCGTYVYVSNRGDDSISCLKFENEVLTLISVTPCGGSYPRDFCVYGGFLFCANERSNSITIFKIEGEKLIDTGIIEKIDAPLCIAAQERT